MPDTEKLHQFLGKMVTDMGAAMNAALVLIGDKLGLYSALAEKGPMTSEDLAKATSTDERYVREWLTSQAASGYVEYDGKSKFSMTPEQTMVFSDPESPVAMAGAFDVIAAAWRDEPQITDAFKTGKGVGWHEHHPCLFPGTERFFRSGYKANLVSNWLPALEGVVKELETGEWLPMSAAAMVLLQLSWHKRSRSPNLSGLTIMTLQYNACGNPPHEAGLSKRVRFEIAKAKEYPGQYDLVSFFDCLHDMGDPQGAAAHVCQTLKPGGYG